jgi:hypothetical protein
MTGGARCNQTGGSPHHRTAGTADTGKSKIKKRKEIEKEKKKKKKKKKREKEQSECTDSQSTGTPTKLNPQIIKSKIPKKENRNISNETAFYGPIRTVISLPRSCP